MIKKIKTKILDIDIDWNPDEHVNIIGGDNGSGKTTLLKKIYENIRQMIQGDDTESDFYLETSGKEMKDVIYLNDQNIPIKKLMNMCFDCDVDSSTTVLDLLIKNELMKLEVTYKTEMNEFAELCNKYKLCNVGIKYMSTGEKQEFLIYLTVFNTRGEHVLLLLDNIDSQLHSDRKRRLLKNLLDINPNLQIIVTTHSPIMVRGWYEQTKEIHQLSTKRNDERDEDR